MYVYVCICICIYSYIPIVPWVYAHGYMSMGICPYGYMYVYIYIYICIYSYIPIAPWVYVNGYKAITKPLYMEKPLQSHYSAIRTRNSWILGAPHAERKLPRMLTFLSYVAYPGNLLAIQFKEI